MVDPTVAALRMRPTGVARRGPLLANPLNLFAIVLIALFALGAVLAAVIAPYDPIVQALGLRLDPPSAAHWLGTDQLGRDIASRLLYGARISLFIGLVVVATAGLVGTTVGLVAGYAGGSRGRGADAVHRDLPRVPAAHPRDGDRGRARP